MKHREGVFGGGLHLHSTHVLLRHGVGAAQEKASDSEGESGPSTAARSQRKGARQREGQKQRHPPARCSYLTVRIASGWAPLSLQSRRGLRDSQCTASSAGASL